MNLSQRTHDLALPCLLLRSSACESSNLSPLKLVFRGDTYFTFYKNGRGMLRLLQQGIVRFCGFCSLYVKTEAL
ncbi:hypothetical protein PsAD37_03923 [Pseudovibrio sp. Ad37]|nr:hypothetical protein PsAD37_03923 [Pseudovibrio sp. Ad37]